MAYSKTWTKNLSADELRDFNRDMAAARPIVEKLNAILNTKINDSVCSTRKKTNFKNANWTHDVADSFGYERALQEILSLLKE